jgi:hypothetical protein
LYLVATPKFVALYVLAATGAGKLDLGHKSRSLIVQLRTTHQLRAAVVNSGLFTAPPERLVKEMHIATQLFSD